jgi:hypothetical protein
VTDDPTDVIPLQVGYFNPYRFERHLLLALVLAYFAAGAVLGFALLELTAVADQINTTPYCRRI